ELVTPANRSGDGVAERSRMFQIAWPASWRPAESPTRGSGLGASETRRGAGVAPGWPGLPPQAASARARTVKCTGRNSRCRTDDVNIARSSSGTNRWDDAMLGAL